MSQKGWTLLAAVLGSGIVFLDGTIVNVALPRIAAELPATLVGALEGAAYVNSGYLATLAALLVLAGGLSDYYGRRRVFAIGLAGFGVTSVLCGLAPNMELLVLFRILQGATGALLVPGSLSIITATFEGGERARAFGLWASATSGLTVLAPLLGGYIVDALSWRIAFLINAPIVVFGLFALRHMGESRDENASGHFDWLGAVVGVIAVGGLAFGAIRGQEQQWQDPIAFAALAVGAVALVAFPLLMARRPNPLVPLGLFRSREFTVVNLSTFLIYGALYTTFLFQALFLQNTLGYTALAAGAIGLPTGILLTLLSTRIGSLSGRWGNRPFLVAGPILMGVGLLWFVRIPSSSQAWLASANDLASLVPPTSTLVDVLPSILLFGLGLTFVVAPITSALMASVPVHNAGLGSAINNSISRVGQPLLTAVIFIAVSASFYGSVRERTGLDDATARRTLSPLGRAPAGTPDEQVVAAREASTDAFRLAAVVGAGLLFAGAAVNAVGLRSGAATRRREPEGGEAGDAVAPVAGH